jgi:hypothetical protein
MSPTIAELAVGLIAMVLVFMLAVRVIPIIIRLLAHYLNRSLDADYVERKPDHYDEYDKR